MKIRVRYGYGIGPSLYEAEYAGTPMAVMEKLAALVDTRGAVVCKIEILEAA